MSVPERPALPVAGRGCVFPLDGDKRLPVPGGSPRGPPALPKAPPWVQRSGTSCPGHPPPLPGDAGTRLVLAGHKQQSGEKFDL